MSSPTTSRPLGPLQAPGTGPAAGDPDRLHDVLVVGGGPSGSSCAYWLAEAGWDVALVEKKVFPREKTCGDGLTPRSVRQIADMGVEGALAGAHRYTGLRAHAFGKVLDLPWPEHPTFPSYGYVITRHDLDAIVNERAVKAGATVWQGTEAINPILEDRGSPVGPGGLASCVGAVVKEKSTGATRSVRARYVVVADGANSRFGRALGTARDRGQPMGMALRGYYTSPGHDQPFIESHLDIRDGDGEVVPGYGWIFPLGDGRVNVGVGLLSTDRRWKGVNTSTLMDHFVAGAPGEWELSPSTCLGPPTGGKLPMGLAVGPRVGATTLVVGDAAGSINPFNGEGIAYGYESGRMAAAAVGEALCGDGIEALHRYEARLEDAYGLYFRVARAFIRVISRPELMRLCVGTGMRSESLMGWILRIMANLLRPDETGPAEAAYRALALIARMAPEGA
ncbi:MAG TPA: geranylgeranyl reductase family protein [Acidimicrobiales bacterium]|nr:geranylgeranyl reductase family protein [Acidimicrobiales bacterium]